MVKYAFVSASCAAVFSVIIISLAISEQGSISGWGAASVLASVALYAVALAFIVWAVVSRAAGMLEVVIAYFFLFPVAVVAIYQSSTQTFSWARVHSETDMAFALLLCIVAILTLALGYFWRGWSPRPPRFGQGKLKIQMAKAGLWFSLILIVATGGIFTVASARFDRVSLQDDGLQQQALLIGSSIALASLLILITSRRTLEARSLLSNKLMILSFSYVFYLYNPISNPRFVFVGFALSTLCAYLGGWEATRRLKLALLTALVGAYFFLFGAFKSLGAGVPFLETSDGGRAVASGKEVFFSGDFDVPQMIANAITYSNWYGYTPLQNLLGYVGFLVPRSVWASKPIGTSYDVMGALGYPFTNLSYPFFLDLYSSGGYLLLIPAMVSLGYALRSAGNSARWSIRKNAVSLSAPFYCLCAGFAPILLRGPVNNVIAFFGSAFYWLLVIYIFSALLRGKSLPYQDS